MNLGITRHRWPRVGDGPRLPRGCWSSDRCSTAPPCWKLPGKQKRRLLSKCLQTNSSATRRRYLFVDYFSRCLPTQALQLETRDNPRPHLRPHGVHHDDVCCFTLDFHAPPHLHGPSRTCVSVSVCARWGERLASSQGCKQAQPLGGSTPTPAPALPGVTRGEDEQNKESSLILRQSRNVTSECLPRGTEAK